MYMHSTTYKTLDVTYFSQVKNLNSRLTQLYGNGLEHSYLI